MTAEAKVLVPNKEWLVKTEAGKVGGIAKNKKGYLFYQKGKTLAFRNLDEINSTLGVAISEDNTKKFKPNQQETQSIYDYPCSSKPYQPVYNVKKKLPLFAKSDKSKSQYCAGYYTIKFRKGWVKSFCPKLITLDRYPFHGPFKSEQDMKTQLNTINKNETNT